MLEELQEVTREFGSQELFVTPEMRHYEPAVLNKLAKLERKPLARSKLSGQSINVHWKGVLASIFGLLQQFPRHLRRLLIFVAFAQTIRRSIDHSGWTRPCCWSSRAWMG